MPNRIDEYIAGFPKHVQKVLKQVRSVIMQAAPAADDQHTRVHQPLLSLTPDLLKQYLSAVTFVHTFKYSG